MTIKSILLGVSIFAISSCSAPGANSEDAPKPASIESESSATLVAQTACQDVEFRQLDFWVGEWDLEWDAGEGKLGTGTNIITKTPFGDCVITENFDGAPTQQFKGMSVSMYHKPAGVWRQTWVDDQGGYFALSGGLQEDGTFLLDMTRLSDTAPYRRMVWKDIKPGSLTWHWQGHKTDETEWADLWVIRYARKP